MYLIFIFVFYFFITTTYIPQNKKYPIWSKKKKHAHQRNIRTIWYRQRRNTTIKIPGKRATIPSLGQYLLFIGNLLIKMRHTGPKRVP